MPRRQIARKTKTYWKPDEQLAVVSHVFAQLLSAKKFPLNSRPRLASYIARAQNGLLPKERHRALNSTLTREVRDEVAKLYDTHIIGAPPAPATPKAKPVVTKITAESITDAINRAVEARLTTLVTEKVHEAFDEFTKPAGK